MKVLIVGQLPKEVGGSYTTGVCNVVYELSKCRNDDVSLYVYATNLPFKKGNSIPNPFCKYYGTRMRYLSVIWSIIKSPFTTFKEWKYYKCVTHMSPIRCEFYKDNYKRVIKEVKPDIIHNMSIVQMAPLYYANKGTDIPILLTLHGVFFDNDKNVEDLSKGNILLADYTTGLTPETMSGIESLRFPKERSFMVPNGTDTNKFFYDDNSRRELRKELNIDNDTIMLITVGSLQHRKGQLSFCEVLRKMPQDLNFKYFIIGKGEDKELIERFVEDNNMQDKVRIIGYVANNDLYKYYSAADVYIHCSYEEGQALSEVEAYATGLRIAVNNNIIGTIVTDTSNSKDYYIFNYNSFDVSSFVQWIKQPINNRESRKKYDWTKVFDMYADIYTLILSK